MYNHEKDKRCHGLSGPIITGRCKCNTQRDWIVEFTVFILLCRFVIMREDSVMSLGAGLTTGEEILGESREEGDQRL